MTGDTQQEAETINNPLVRGVILIIIMFTDNEINEYKTDFCKIGLTNEEEQKQVLEFLYTLGTIIYQVKQDNNEIKILDYGKEEVKEESC